MREFIKITLNLFVIAVVAAALLGVVFIFTEQQRKLNYAHNLETSMLSYLPAEVVKAENYKFAHIYRYLVEDGSAMSIGYLMPTKDHGHIFITVTPEGELIDNHELTTSKSLDDQTERDAALQALLGKKVVLTQTDAYIIGESGGQRIAYYAEGRTIGFKTWVSMMVVMNPDYSIRGLEILEQEEDPGLGAEIDQEYFRNQFLNKTLAQLPELKVIKVPLPDDYKKALEKDKWASRGLTPQEAERIMQEHHGDDIYSITGSTISSTRVTNGVKKIVDAFVKRMQIIDNLVKVNNLPVDF